MCVCVCVCVCVCECVCVCVCVCVLCVSVWLLHVLLSVSRKFFSHLKLWQMRPRQLPLCRVDWFGENCSALSFSPAHALEKSQTQSWTLSVFFVNFFHNKKGFFGIFYQVITYFCTSPISKAHSQSNYLDKKCIKSLFKKFKNTEILLQLWPNLTAVSFQRSPKATRNRWLIFARVSRTENSTHQFNNFNYRQSAIELQNGFY